MSCYRIGIAAGLGAALAWSGLLAASPGPSAPSAEPAPAAIREFAPDTTAALGRAIFEEDALAWTATDVLQASVSRAKLEQQQVSGWVVDPTGPTPVVRFVRGAVDSAEAAYEVSFRKGAKPRLVAPESKALSPSQRSKLRALRTAEKAIADGRHESCGGTFNYVTLPDPEQDGWLVYFLRPKPAAHAIPVGGHYRVSVTADGLTVRQVDRLFASCLTMDRKAVPKDGATVGIFMSHVVSPRPLETHVFLSLQEKLPFYVITPDRSVWKVDLGKMEKTAGPGAPAAAADASSAKTRAAAASVKP